MSVVTYSAMAYLVTAIIAYAVIGVVVGLSKFLSSPEDEE